MLPTRQNLANSLKRSFQLASRCAYSVGRKEVKTTEVSREVKKPSEANPEYHNASSDYAQNFRKHQKQEHHGNVQTMRIRNPHYRWADFRRRMVYGTYDSSTKWY